MHHNLIFAVLAIAAPCGPGSWFSCRYVSVEVDAGAGVGVDGEGAADGAAAAIARKLALPGSDGWIRSE